MGQSTTVRIVKPKRYRSDPSHVHQPPSHLVPATTSGTVTRIFAIDAAVSRFSYSVAHYYDPSVSIYLSLRHDESGSLPHTPPLRSPFPNHPTLRSANWIASCPSRVAHLFDQRNTATPQGGAREA